MIVDIASRDSLEGVDVHLRFVIHPIFKEKKILKSWDQVRNAIYFNLVEERDRKLQKWVLTEWISYCSLETNKNLSFLDRMEGGIGGIDGKQIRCRLLDRTIGYERQPNELLLDVFDTETDKWSFEELRDLLKAFEEFASAYIHPDDPVQGYIVIKS